MKEAMAEALDPRILRTRHLLQDALCKLLKQKPFDDISVQDIADAATINRATFYDHYADKRALLACMVGWRFHEMLADRQVKFDSTCRAALTSVVLAVCDYLLDLMGPAGNRKVEPHMESAMIGVLQGMFARGGCEPPPDCHIPREMAASAAAWAIYGAAREWAQGENRPSSKEIAGTIAELVEPILDAVRSDGKASPQVCATALPPIEVADHSHG